MGHAVGPMCGGSSRHVTSSLWLSLGKTNMRMRLLPGLLELKALQTQAVCGSMCMGRAEITLSFRKPLCLCLSAAGGGGCQQWGWGECNGLCKSHDDVGEVS